MSIHKRGDAFDCSGPVAVTVNGAAITNLTGWTGQCQFRTPVGDLVGTGVFEWLDATQALCRVRVADTSEWPLGTVETDIRLVDPEGHPVSTAVASFTVTRGVTQP